MLTEDEKREKIFSMYSFSTHSLVELTHGVSCFSDFVHDAVEFVRFLPNWATRDARTYVHVNEDLCTKAVAYILYDERLPKWILADIARVYCVKLTSFYGKMYINAYKNVDILKRRRWGVFA